MGEKLGCEIDNSEILGTEEKLGEKILKENILNKVMKNSTSVDFKKNYDYFKSLDSEKINILNNLSDNEFKVVEELLMTEGNNNEKLFSNLKILQENNIIFSAGYFSLILNKISKIGLIINENHIKILKNNSKFFYIFINGEINNGTEKQIEINKITTIINLFNKFEYKIPKKFLSSTLIFSEDIKYIEESLEIAKKYNINDKHLRYFLGLRADKDLYKKIDNEFLKQSENWPTWEGDKYFNKYFKILLDKGILYLGNEGTDGGLQNITSVEKKSFNSNKINQYFLNKNGLNLSFYKLSIDIGGGLNSINFKTGKENKKAHRIGTTIGGEALISKSIIEDLKSFNNKGLFNGVNLELFEEIISANEVTHAILEVKFKIPKNGILPDELQKIKTGVKSIGKIYSNIHLHEFLSDCGSYIISKKYTDLILNNLKIFTTIKIINNKILIDYEGGYKYTYKFIENLLNNILIKNKNIKINEIRKRTDIIQYILDNLTEEDYNYIQAEYKKQGKIWMKAIKNLNLKEKNGTTQ